MHAVHREAGLSLDGEWRFQLLPSPDAPPTNDWQHIAVPGCWTMQGVGDRPHYTNVQMPFPGEPPHVPADNPTGLYERDFELPEAWLGRRVVLHVGAARSMVIVTLNDIDVGIGKDSHLASEFDVTAHLRDGANHLRLTVPKWSDATFIEDQDQWWHAGLTRSVFLYATAPVHLGDVHVVARPVDDGAGQLDIAVQVGGLRRDLETGWRIEARLEGWPEVLEPPFRRRSSAPLGHGRGPAGPSSGGMSCTAKVGLGDQETAGGSCGRTSPQRARAPHD